MLKEVSLKFINNAIQQALSLDPSTQRALKPLVNKVIVLHITGFDKTVFCVFTESTMQLCDHHEGKVDTTLSGGPFSLLAILLTKELNVSGVTIEGEIATAQQAKQFAETLDIDWEDLLASKIGGTPAYYLHKIGSKLKTYFKQQGQELQDNLADYLKDEKQYLVSPEQVESLYHDIDECRFQVDRLAARLQHLKNKSLA